MHSFCIIIFCLDKLWHQGSKTSCRVVDLLPAHLVIHLHHLDTSVLVSGAGESHHFGPIRMVDMQHLFVAHWHCFMYADPTVADCHWGKCRLVIVSMVINDYCHKPMKIQLAQGWFGQLGLHCGWLGWCGYDTWPAWHKDNGLLYRWRYHECLNLWYMAHNVWVPLSFVAMLAQAKLCRSPSLFQDRRPLNVAWCLIREVLDSVCTFTGDDWDFSFDHVAHVVLDVADPIAPTNEPVTRPSKPLEDDNMISWNSHAAQFDLDKDTDSHPSSRRGSPRLRPPSLVQLQGPTPVMERERPTPPSGGVSIGPSTSMTHAPGRGLKRKHEPEDAIERQALSWVGQQPPKKARRHRYVKFSPLGLGVVLNFHHPTVEYPEWGRCCGFCGSCGHLFNWGGISSCAPMPKVDS